MSKPREKVVFFFDVDNTLLDNDKVTADLHKYLDHFGGEVCDRYWEIFEELRAEQGYADYLQTLQRYRLEELHDARLLRMSSYLVDYPFANRLYPGSLDAIEHAQSFGKAVVLSDGDAVFQPRKVERSGIFEAVRRSVIILIHKEQSLEYVESVHPADHYVMLDDKLRILTAMKEIWGDRLTTVFVKQGHYATEAGVEDRFPAADITLGRIGEFVDHDFSHLAD